MTPTRLLIGLAVALLGASLVGAALLLQGRDDPVSPRASVPAREPASQPAGGLRAELQELRGDLEWEAAERERLEGELGALQREVARLSGRSAPEPTLPSAERTGAPVNAQIGKRFDESGLLATGMEPDEARWLHQRYDAYQLELLYVIDNAQRAGVRPGSELLRLEAELRAELGEEVYDGLLYAQGKINRVVVSDVFMRSPAEEADIRERDVVLRYDGARVFTPQDLRRATKGGVAGESVPVELLRGGVLMRLFVPRGPLGITLISDSRPPAPQG